MRHSLKGTAVLKVVVLLIGHNDQKQYDSTRYTTPIGTYTENLGMFVNQTRKRGAHDVAKMAMDECISIGVTFADRIRL